MYEDVPDHLQHPLWAWASPWLNATKPDGIGRIRAVANHMRWPYADLPRSRYSTLEASMREFIEQKCMANPETFLQVIEHLLGTHVNSAAAESLDRTLALGNSAYAVGADFKSLAMRVDPTVRRRAEATVADADPGPAHWLTDAWNDAYGREPRPGPAYDAAIRAVEAALRGVVIPNNARATITQIINALRDGRGKFAFVLEDARGSAAGANEPIIDGVEVVIWMLRSLAYGQKTRHGTSGTVTVNSAEEARTAVQLAVTLVQIAGSGSLRRR